MTRYNEKWTAEEDARLREQWALHGIKCRHQFPNRSRTALTCRASTLQVKSPNHWSDQDIEVLRMHYAEGGAEACAPLLERQRDIACIKAQANRLGLVRRPRDTRPKEAPVCVLQSAMRTRSPLEMAWGTRVLEPA